eukprot:CAMPEP_0168322554 /NCGR_PEP_ID=MMETSP0213-20121227/2956_1 /TAXON_ID=151035 /ORGANISM="Euplotes harpa, Strain FSP1.4" /LENGTH=104 /DNA_ID=CAMNT_0008324459 /DNA_START=335 /DNA_END=646 /DNA_ORIENTATION=-
MIHLQVEPVDQLAVLHVPRLDEDTVVVAVLALHLRADDVVLLEVLPHHRFVFFGPSSNLPSGEIDRGEEEIRVLRGVDVNLPLVVLDAHDSSDNDIADSSAVLL